MRSSKQLSRLVVFAGATLISLDLSAAALAQSEDCTKALNVDTEASQSDDRVRLASLRIIDRTRFEQIKEGGGAGAEILIEGVPLKAWGDYDSFNEARSREYEYYGFTMDEERSSSYLRQYLSPTGASTFIECMKLKAANHPGVHLWARNITPEGVEVAIQWSPPPGSIVNGALQAQITGSSADAITKLPAAMVPNSESRFIFSRTPTTDFHMVVNMNGYTDSVLVPTAPTIHTSSACNEGGLAFLSPVNNSTLTGPVVIAGVISHACRVGSVTMLYDCWDRNGNAGPSWRQISSQTPPSLNGQNLTLRFQWDSNGAPRLQNNCQFRAVVTYLSGKSVDNYLVPVLGALSS